MFLFLTSACSSGALRSLPAVNSQSQSSGSVRQIQGTQRNFAAAVLADTPYGYWPLHETSGTTATDLGSGGNAANYVGNGLLGQTALTNDAGAASWNANANAGTGAGNYIVTSATPNAYPSSATGLTWEAVIKPGAADLAPAYEQRTILNNRGPNTTTASWSIRLHAGSRAGTGYINITNNSGTDFNTPDGSIVAGQTYLIDFTANKTTGLTAYINGVPAATNSAVFNALYAGASAPFFIGTSGTGNANQGAVNYASALLISDVSVYPTTLSQARIAAHYAGLTNTSQSAPPVANGPFSSAVLGDSPYAYWPLHETSGTTASDLGSGGNPATYNGAGLQGQAALTNDSGAASWNPNADTNNGSANYLATSANPNGYPANATGLTWELVVQPSAQDLAVPYAQGTLLNNHGANDINAAWSIRLRGGSRPGTGFINVTNNSGTDYNTPDGSIVAGKTYLVDFTANRSSGLVTYVNGVAVASNPAVFNALYAGVSAPFFIGVAGSGSGNAGLPGKLHGTLISDVSLYATVLSPQRIAAHYTALSGSAPVSTPSPTLPSGKVPSVAPGTTPIAGVLPRFGVYNSCEIDTNEAVCEQQQSEMVSDGITNQINYLSLMAHKTGPQSLTAYFQHAAAIGMTEWINIKAILLDTNQGRPGGLDGTDIATGSLAADCGATTNRQILQCVQSVAATVPGVSWGWYLYDEPGCPASLGYCNASLNTQSEYARVGSVASFIGSISSAPIFGIQGGPSASDQSVTNNEYSWITSATTPNTGGDDYPIGRSNEKLSDLGSKITSLITTVNATYQPETISWTGQAFSWTQESDTSCGGSLTTCPYPTQAQLQTQRDQILYYAARSGRNLKTFFWYEWASISCTNTFSGCNAAANKAAIAAVNRSPFPTSAP